MTAIDFLEKHYLEFATIVVVLLSLLIYKVLK